MAMAIWVTAWPPVIGYAYLLIGSGYVFGWFGFIPAYIGVKEGLTTTTLTHAHSPPTQVL